MLLRRSAILLKSKQSLLPMTENSIRVGVENQGVEIGYHNRISSELVYFLFQDMIATPALVPRVRFDVVAAGKKPMLSLWQKEKRYYFGKSFYKLGYILFNEVLYHCIADNKSHYAIHAGAIRQGSRGVIFPGKSGAGKSLLTAWLLIHGSSYLSDELVLISPENGKITALARPLSFKKEGLTLLPGSAADDATKIISDKRGSMVPHRLFNPNFTHQESVLDTIVFPEYNKDSRTRLEKVSPAKSLLYLLSCYVNAKNFQHLGISNLSQLVKRCDSYKLTYNSFEGLKDIIPALLSR